MGQQLAVDQLPTTGYTITTKATVFVSGRGGRLVRMAPANEEERANELTCLLQTMSTVKIPTKKPEKNIEQYRGNRD